MTLAAELRRMGACDDAVAWVGSRTLAQAWAECERGDWMAWLCDRISMTHPGLRLAAADIAESVWHRVEADSQLACAWAIDCARRMVTGECDEDERAAAWDAAGAAWVAAGDAAGAAAGSAAWAAAWAAAGAAAGDAAGDAAGAAAGSAAWAAAGSAAWAAAGAAQRKLNADILRQYITAADVRTAMEAYHA